jgi:hypothetical protein
MMNINKRALFLIIGILVLAFLGYVTYLAIEGKDKTAKIDIQSAVPDDINVTIDGGKVASNGKVSVKPGSHKVVAERKGFEGKTQTVDAKAYETKTVRLLLRPNGPEGSDWARSHPDAFREFEGVAGREFDQKGELLSNKFPIISALPEVHPTWRVDYGQSEKHPNDSNALEVIITSVDDVSKQQALDWMKKNGYNPADYEIVYRQPQTSGG